MKINIFVRHCKFSANSARKGRPPYFTREGCFNNMLNTLDSDCVLNVSFDGTLKESGHFLEKDVYKGRFNLFEKKSGNDAASFLSALEFARSLNLNDGDVIYFTEDDYLHHADWASVLKEGLTQVACDYATLYDHNDKYFFKMYAELQSSVIHTANIHWRTIPNTTNTYGCLVKTFKRDYDTHRKWCDLSSGLTRDFDKFADLASQGKGLISPMPGYSTHCEPEFMSPVVDWEEVWKKTSTI